MAKIIVLTFGLAMVTWSVREHWPANDKSDSDFTSHYAEMVFDLLPENAILFLYGDVPTFVSGYFHHIENRRPDVTLYSVTGNLYSNRLYGPFTPQENIEQILIRFIESTKSRVFFLVPVMFDFGRTNQEWYGFHIEVKKGGRRGTIDITRYERGEKFFAYLIHLQTLDHWERAARDRLLFHYGQYLGLIHFSGDPTLRNPMRESFRLAEGNYTCLLGMSYSLIKYGNASHWDQVSSWLDRAEGLKHELLTKEYSALPHYLKGLLLEKSGQRVEALTFFRKSRDIYPHPNNKAIEALEQYKINFK